MITMNYLLIYSILKVSQWSDSHYIARWLTYKVHYQQDFDVPPSAHWSTHVEKGKECAYDKISWLPWLTIPKLCEANYNIYLIFPKCTKTYFVTSRVEFTLKETYFLQDSGINWKIKRKKLEEMKKMMK